MNSIINPSISIKNYPLTYCSLPELDQTPLYNMMIGLYYPEKYQIFLGHWVEHQGFQLHDRNR